MAASLDDEFLRCIGAVGKPGVKMKVGKHGSTAERGMWSAETKRRKF
jgi:hypothetical protein